MFSIKLVLASCVMLSTAQLQFQPNQMANLPNLEPLQLSTLPHSQTLMTQTAHTILRQNPGAPLQPGILGGLPVLVSEAAQNVLDQESKIVGYNISPAFSVTQPQQQLLQSPVVGQVQQQNQVLTASPPQLLYQTPPQQVLTTVVHPGQEREESPRLQQAQLVAASPSVQVQYEPTEQQVLVGSVGASLHRLQSQNQPAQSQVTNQVGQILYSALEQQSPVEIQSQNVGQAQTQLIQTDGAAVPSQIFYHTFDQQVPVGPVVTAQGYEQPIQIQNAAAPQPSHLYYTTHQQVPSVTNTNAIVQPVVEKQHESVQLVSPIVTSEAFLPTTPQIIPITSADAVRSNQVVVANQDQGQTLIHHEPQSLSIPLIPTQPQEEQLSVVPIRATASLKDLVNSGRQSSSSSPQASLFRSSRPSSPSSRNPPARTSRPEASRTPIRQIVQNTRANDNIAYMRPPPPFLRDSSQRPVHETNDRPQQTYGSPTPPNDFITAVENNRPQSRPQEIATTPPPAFDFPSQQNDNAIEISGLRSENVGERPRIVESPRGSSVRTLGGYNSRPSGYSSNGNQQNQNPRRPTVHKHIFVHAAPETYTRTPRVRVIRPQFDQEKHVNIIFVRSPSPNPETQTVVELPPMQQPKTLVYVLARKPNENEDVKVVAPPAPKPTAPEIYFIRYGANRGSGTQDLPVPNLQSLLDNTSYGAPAILGNQNPFQQDVNSNLNGRFKRNKDYGIDVYAPLMAYSTTGQINEITQEEAEFRKTSLDDFF